MPHQEYFTDDIRRCIEECHTCRATCLETIAHCLGLGGLHAEPDHIKLLADCASICETSAGYMARSSPRHDRVCSLCAEICELCAHDCQRIGPKDSTMRRCADVCLK